MDEPRRTPARRAAGVVKRNPNAASHAGSTRTNLAKSNALLGISPKLAFVPATARVVPSAAWMSSSIQPEPYVASRATRSISRGHARARSCRPAHDGRAALKVMDGHLSRALFVPNATRSRIRAVCVHAVAPEAATTLRRTRKCGRGSPVRAQRGTSASRADGRLRSGPGYVQASRMGAGPPDDAPARSCCSTRLIRCRAR